MLLIKLILAKDLVLHRIGVGCELLGSGYKFLFILLVFAKLIKFDQRFTDLDLNYLIVPILSLNCFQIFLDLKKIQVLNCTSLLYVAYISGLNLLFLMVMKAAIVFTDNYLGNHIEKLRLNVQTLKIIAFGY